MPLVSTHDDDYSADFEDGPYCDVCGCDMEWEDCDRCGAEGYDHHDCGEDVCCCLHPDNNVLCDQCDGKGGWWYCPNAKRHPALPAPPEQPADPWADDPGQRVAPL